MTVPDLVQDELRRQGVAGDDLLLCAVSGGADSVSLSAAVHAAGYGRLHLGWINHNLRSREEMRRDSEAVHALGSHLGTPVLVEEIREGLVRTHAHRSGQGIEQVARRFRYEALVRIATRLASETWSSPENEAVSGRPTVYLLTAHHGDDQAETVLARIADGHPATVPIATPVRRELAESPIRVILLRPALSLEGRVLRQWGREHGFQWAEDATNQDVSFRRNALRHRVLPPLRETLPDSARMIARFGTGHDHLLAAMKALIPPAAYGRWTSSDWHVERAVFRELPHAAQELVLRDAAYHVSSSDRVDAGFIGEVLRQLHRRGTAGSDVRISGSDLVCVATAETITVRRDIVPGGQRGYLFPVLPGSVVVLDSDDDGMVPREILDSFNGEGRWIACTALSFPAMLRDQRDGDVIVWRGRERALSQVARREGIPRASRAGAAVVESTIGIEAVFWRGGRYVVRDGGTWQEQCTNPKPSAVIFRMQG